MLIPRAARLAIALLAGGCAQADIEVLRVDDLGALPTSASIKGRDGGYSARVGDRSVWFYGDTVLSLEGEDGSSWRDNTWSWTTDLDLTDGVDGFTEPVDALGAPREFFPETPEEAAYNDAHRGDPCLDPCGGREILWPMAPVALADGGALVFYVKIHGEPGAWNFFSRGIGVAAWTGGDSAPTRPEPGVIDGEPTLLFAPDEPAFGDAATLGPDGLLYAWGRDDDVLAKVQLLGRVAPADVQDRAAWRFWDGQAWSADIRAARGTFVGAAQESVFFDADLGLWLAMYEEEPGGPVVVRTAPAPQGPWSAPGHVADTLGSADGWPYSGIAHPEFDGEGILFTYYRSTGDWTGEIHALRVVLGPRG